MESVNFNLCEIKIDGALRSSPQIQSSGAIEGITRMLKKWQEGGIRSLNDTVLVQSATWEDLQGHKAEAAKEGEAVTERKEAEKGERIKRRKGKQL